MPTRPKGLRCNAKTKRTGLPCRHGAGQRTTHPGVGHCYLHGGTSTSGNKFAARQAATRALAALGVPYGSGDPFELLRDAVRFAHGQVRAASLLVLDAVDAAATEGGEPPTVPLEAAMAALDAAIRTAARTGKATVDADVAEREVTIAEEQAAVIIAALRHALDAAGVVDGDARMAAERALIEDLRVSVPAGDARN